MAFVRSDENHSIPDFLPKLLDFNWQVNVKSASNVVSRMSTPTCLLELQIEDPPPSTDQQPTIAITTVELSKETLHTMLDGLGKIREQLSSVAK